MNTILFTGSRDWTSWQLLRETFERIHRTLGPCTAIHGGARGVDRFIDKLAPKFKWRVDPIYPNYGRYGKYEAPKRRNITMLEMKPDFVVGFWDGESGGTKHCLDFAINVFRIPTIVITL